MWTLIHSNSLINIINIPCPIYSHNSINKKTRNTKRIHRTRIHLPTFAAFAVCIHMTAKITFLSRKMYTSKRLRWLACEYSMPHTINV